MSAMLARLAQVRYHSSMQLLSKPTVLKVKRLIASGLVLSTFLNTEHLAYAQSFSNQDDGIIENASFNPNNVLNDEDILKLGDMRLGDVQSFLDSRPGILKTYRTQDIDGVEKSVAEIIWRVANTYQLNPRYLLALMQKEQSLVDDPNPSQKQFDWATGYAICDSCSMNDPRLQDFRGLTNQLEWAAKQHRQGYLQQILARGTTISGKAAGKPVFISGQIIVPANNATAMLYTYTPHVHGNYNLWRIWQRWFALRFPEGTIVRGETTGQIFLLKQGERRPIKTLAIAASLVDTRKIVTTEDSRLTGYRLGDAVNFANYSLVQTPDGQRYLLNGSKKLLIQSKAFDKFGFNQDEVLDVTVDDLKNYTDGPDITTSSTYPTGLLVKDPNKTYWYIENNLRQRIPDTAFLTLYFRHRAARSWTTKQLSAVPQGPDYGLQDGELIRGKTSPAVYAIELGQRRAILSEQAFLELGYAWKNVITLPDRLVESYTLGAPLDPHAPLPAMLEESIAPVILTQTATGTVQAASFTTR